MNTKTLLWRQARDIDKDSASYINGILVEDEENSKTVFDALYKGITQYTIWSRVLKRKNRWYPIAPDFSSKAEQFMKPNATTGKVLECFKNSNGEYMIGSRLSPKNAMDLKQGFLFSSNKKDINEVCDDLESTFDNLNFDYNKNDIVAIRQLVPKYNRCERLTRVVLFIFIITLIILFLCN